MNALVSSSNEDFVSFCIYPPRVPFLEFQYNHTIIKKPLLCSHKTCCSCCLGHHNAITKICFVPSKEGYENDVLFTASRDSTIHKHICNNKPWKPFKMSPLELQAIMIGHTQWVNDLCILSTNDTNLVISASNDCTVKFWQDTQPYDENDRILMTPIATYRHHTDYVTSIAATSINNSQNHLISASVDRKINITDIETGAQVSELLILSKQLIWKELFRRSSAVARVAVTDSGKYLACCSGQELIVLDLRASKACLHIPKAHSDFLRRIALRNDGQHIISTAADATARLWDLRKGSVEPYSELKFYDSAWALATTKESHRTFFVGDRSGSIAGFKCNEFQNESNTCFWTTKFDKSSTELQKVPESLRWSLGCVLDLEYDPLTQRLWSATGNSSLTCWDLSLLSNNKSEASAIHSNLTAAAYKLSGFPKLREATLLTDQRTIITRSILFDIETWDIVTGVQTGHLENENLDNAIVRLNAFTSRPNWCVIDVALGVIRVTLSPSTAFLAEIANNNQETLNFGCATLNRLFQRLCDKSQENLKNFSFTDLSEQHHQFKCTIVYINGVPLPGLTCEYTQDDMKYLSSWILMWIQEKKILVTANSSLPHNIIFFVHPAPNCILGYLPRIRLCRNRCMRMSTLAEYILEHTYLKKISNAQSSLCFGVDHNQSSSSDTEYNHTLSINCLTLTCLNQPLDFSWDLGTVKDLVWRKHQVRGHRRPFEILFHYTKSKSMTKGSKNNRKSE